MREILFRGKRLDNGEWVEGSLISFGGGEKVIFPSKSKVYMPVGKNVFCSADYYDVDPNTVGQFTDLLDKNGKQIFEGDVFAWGYAGVYDMRYVVFYDAVTTSFIGVRKHGFLSLSGITIEIIGNIHDNPELLEGGYADG